MTLTVFDPTLATNTSPPPRARVGSEIPAPVGATATRGDGPDTTTVAANVPITIRPTPTSANRRFTAIAPQPPESIKEREACIGPSINKPIMPQQPTSADLPGRIQVWAVRRRSRKAHASE